VSVLSVALLAVLVAAVWLMLLRLGLAFWRSELSWRYVAEQSRVGAPWYYRVAGVWGAMPGSLLLLTGIVGLVALVALRRIDVADRVGAWFALGTVGALTVVDLTLASPFRRLSIPAVEGFGLTPILEHPAMAIHPPLLYLGLACALPVALIAMRREPSGADASEATRRSRRWLLAVVGLLAAAMALGAAWSYMEQGWGGYWAWDPVENTSLLVWLASLAALHALPLGGRLTGVASILPWSLALLGTTLVRSGIAASIHCFSEQAAVGWCLLGLTAASTVTMALVIRPRPARDSEDASARYHRRVAAVIVGAVGLCVLVGTAGPVLADIAGGRHAAVRGKYFSGLVGPLAAVAVPFMALRLRRWRGTATVAHVGALILFVGIAASTFDSSEDVTLPAATTKHVSGIDVTNLGIAVVDGARRDTTAVVLHLRVDGNAMSPSLVVYPDRGGRLAEVATISRPWRDVQIALVDAGDNGAAVIVVRTRPLVWLLWIGAAIVAFTTVGGALMDRRRRPADVAVGPAVH
jgi:cytochrome c biogenesis factor